MHQRPGTFVRGEGLTEMRRITAILLRPAVRLSLAGLDSRLAMIPRATDLPFASAVGPEPLHLAILGYGVGPGWGVATHALAMPGQLARALSHRLGRGVEVEVITENTTLPWLLGLLDELDLSAFDAIVLSPGAYEAMSLMPVARYRSLMQEAITRAATKDGSRPVVILGIPPLDTAVNPESFLGAKIRERGALLEAAVSDVVDDDPAVAFVPLTLKGPVVDIRDSAADRYRAWSESVAAALAARLAPPAQMPTRPVTPLHRLTALMRSAFDADAALVVSAADGASWIDARRSHRDVADSAVPLLQAAGRSTEALFEYSVAGRLAVAQTLRSTSGGLTGVSAVFHPDPASVNRRLLRNLGVLIASELEGDRPVTVS